MTDHASAGPASTAVTPGRWIGMGWGIVKADLGQFILITVIAIGILLAASFTVLGPFVVGGPLLAGLFIAVRRRMLEGRTELTDLFAGFDQIFDALVIHLLVCVFLFIGILFCFFGIFVASAFYLFPYLFLVDRRLPFWDALESSRKHAMGNLAGYVVFAVLLTLLNFLGLICAGVGILVTVPVTVAAIAVAYGETVGFHSLPPGSRGPVVIP